MMRRVFSLFALLVLGSWGMAAYEGWELGSSKRGKLPPNARQGGYRSYSFWRGGK
jgi:hypothetical protein